MDRVNARGKRAIGGRLAIDARASACAMAKKNAGEWRDPESIWCGRPDRRRIVDASGRE